MAREPAHVPALNLLGLIFQEAGRHKLAVKSFAAAIASDPLNAACHYNLASSYQVLNRQDEAAVHFSKAIALGMSRKSIEDFIFQNPTITAWIARIDASGPLPLRAGQLLAPDGLEAIARDIFLRCALEAVLIRTEPLERLLTLVRAALLDLAAAGATAGPGGEHDILRLCCALAQQCFINEYVFALSDGEKRKSAELRDTLEKNLAEGGEIHPLLLAAVAAYRPLHLLDAAKTLLSRAWPDAVAGLVRCQVIEPLQEAEDLPKIPALTRVADAVSLTVMRQYEENPYPRWTISPLAAFATEHELAAVHADQDAASRVENILIAGCGSGQHAIQVAHWCPDARVLAVDISLPSLAYARRKTREAGLHNIDYAQADILELNSMDRRFDRIEAVGVLHHLGVPETGWRVLLSLLRRGGDMRVGLYSEAARRDIVAVRAFIAERGYRPVAEDIRKCRADIFRDVDKRRWKGVTEAGDFYSMSGCRDLLFNVMEHRFTIPRVKAFLNEQRLAFLGFEVEPRMLEKFQSRFPGAAALTDLDKWDAFEADNPQTFRNMYVFTVRKD